MDQNALEEKFFIPSTEGYEELKSDLSVLAHRGTNGIFYFYMDHGIYGIDLKSLEYVADHIWSYEGPACGQCGPFPGSLAGETRESGIHRRSRSWISTPGIRPQLGGEAGSVSRILGFVGNDCIYGTGDSGDYLMSNGSRDGTCI